MQERRKWIQAVIILLALLVHGCIVIDLDGCTTSTVKGSGNIVTEETQVSEFKEVSLKGTGKIFISKGPAHSLQIETDDNILPLIETTVSNGKLTISHEGYNPKTTTLNYFITVRELDGISIYGSGDALCNSQFIAEDFYAEIKGSGDISLDLEVKNLKSEISGSGNINLSGKAISHMASIKGSGGIDAFAMASEDVSVSIKGSGDCKVNATRILTAEIAGSGDVYYKGRPRINSSIKGSGALKSRD
jgi:hypothetical protein